MNENFYIKDFEEIIEDLKKENNFIRKVKVFFNPVKYSIAFDIKQLQKSQNQCDKNYLIHIIKTKKLPLILKIDSFIFLFSKFKQEITSDISNLNIFISDYVKTFKKFRFKDKKFINSCINFTKELITTIYEKKGEQTYYFFTSNYPALFKILYSFLKKNYFSKAAFLSLFSIYNEIPFQYHNLEKWILQFDFYFEIIKDLSQVKEFIFNFLSRYNKDLMLELNLCNLYPNPIKFCEYIEKKFKSKNKKSFLFNIYLEFYANNTTNFFPPLLIKKINCNIYYLITNNLNNRIFDYNCLDNLFERIIKLKPKKKYLHYFAKRFLPFIVNNFMTITRYLIQENYL